MLDRRKFIAALSAAGTFLTGGVAHAARTRRFSSEGHFVSLKTKRGVLTLTWTSGEHTLKAIANRRTRVFTKTGDERPRRAEPGDLEEDAHILVEGVENLRTGVLTVSRITIIIPSYSG
jgi:hypothetical protein